MDAENILHSPAIAQVMLNFGSEQGLTAETCLSGTGISAELLKDSEALVRRSQEMRLIENLMAALPDVPALGFELGSRYGTPAFGVWGFALTTSKNLIDAAALGCRYMRLSTAYCDFRVVENGDEIGVEFDASAIPAHLREFLRERDMATALNLAKQVNLVSQPVQRLEMSGPAPAHGWRIQELSEVPVVFAAAHNRVVMKRADALQPLPTYNAVIVRQLEAQCRELLPQRELSDIAQQVRRALLGQSGFVKTSDEVADELGLSPRSLRRKLEAENTTFRALQDEARQQLAEQLLTTTTMKLEELAFHLGYSDAASFTRACRRWFAASPGELRRRATD